MHCYQPVGTMAVMLANIGILSEGETAIVAAVDHNDARLHYALVSPLHPVVACERWPIFGPTLCYTVLEGYDCFSWTWASAESLFFPEAPLPNSCHCSP